MNLRRLTPSNKPKEQPIEKPSEKIKIVNKHICVTGKISTWTRRMVHNWLVNQGALVDATVTARTDYLLKGRNAGVTKLSAAQRMGIKIVEPKDLELKTPIV